MADSSAPLNGSGPTVATTNAASRDGNAESGHSTNCVKLYTNAALIKYSLLGPSARHGIAATSSAAIAANLQLLNVRPLPRPIINPAIRERVPNTSRAAG